MPIQPTELGDRLRRAREACGLSQEIASSRLNLSRSALSQIELGHRAVSGLELDAFAYLYGRDIRDFLAEDFTADDVVTALFRVAPELEDGGENDALRKCLAIWRQTASLESLLGIRPRPLERPPLGLAVPRTKGEAIRQAERVATAERHRLGLGARPLGDLVEWLESEGVRTACIQLPEGISGLTLRHPDKGVFIAINKREPSDRQRFSFVHEYGHVVMDAQRSGLVSRRNERDTIVEVRANAFTAAFLLPEDGVRAVIAGLGKEGPHTPTELFDESDVTRVGRTGTARAQPIRMYDVVHVAHHFGVSRTAAIYRLGNLGLLNTPERNALLEEDARRGRELAARLRLDHDVAQHDATPPVHRILLLALEAVRREAITRGKFNEVARLVDIPAGEAEDLLRLAGLEDEPADVLEFPEDE
jgi:Zn-dependent peptidase ImmA (M78 family)/transcriptional regulator with XRE-family HTH domain